MMFQPELEIQNKRPDSTIEKRDCTVGLGPLPESVKWTTAYKLFHESQENVDVIYVNFYSANKYVDTYESSGGHSMPMIRKCTFSRQTVLGQYNLNSNHTILAELPRSMIFLERISLDSSSGHCCGFC